METFIKVVPLMLSLSTIIIIVRQRSFERNKLREEKRERIFDSLQDFLSSIVISGPTKIDMSKVSEYMQSICRASFYFDKPTVDYLKSISEAALYIYPLWEKLYPSNSVGGLPVGLERSKISEDISEKYLWIVNQRDISLKVFEKYFKF